MTVEEHLLIILAEECSEVSQRVSKALRFGLREIQPGQPLTNEERIIQEFSDLFAVYEMLGFSYPDFVAMRIKKDKVRAYLEYSAECGCVDLSSRGVTESTEVS